MVVVVVTCSTLNMLFHPCAHACVPTTTIAHGGCQEAASAHLFSFYYCCFFLLVCLLACCLSFLLAFLFACLLSCLLSFLLVVLFALFHDLFIFKKRISYLFSFYFFSGLYFCWDFLTSPFRPLVGLGGSGVGCGCFSNFRGKGAWGIACLLACLLACLRVCLFFFGPPPRAPKQAEPKQAQNKTELTQIIIFEINYQNKNIKIKQNIDDEDVRTMSPAMWTPVAQVALWSC